MGERTLPSALDRARELGATLDVGINWEFANDFPTRDAAEAFASWCGENGFETRGVVDTSVQFRRRLDSVYFIGES
jgi:hypothetical protein